MKYRPLDANGDYTVAVPYLSNSPATVGQAVLTRLRLLQGEWFLDVTDGTPYQSILGKRQPGSNPDALIKNRILSTQGVTSIVSYSSSYNGAARTLTVSATIATIYGQTVIAVTL
jgi:hypothetical protein